MRKISKKGIICIICVAAAIALLTAAWSIICAVTVSNPVACIYSDGKLLYEINLNQVSETYTLIVPYGDSSNTITVSQGKICVSDADCPDKVCINTGWISNGIVPIICLPNRLEIRIKGGADSDIDAVVK